MLRKILLSLKNLLVKKCVSLLPKHKKTEIGKLNSLQPLIKERFSIFKKQDLILFLVLAGLDAGVVVCAGGVVGVILAVEVGGHLEEAGGDGVD